MTDDAGPDEGGADPVGQVAEPVENADPDAPVDFTPGELHGAVDPDDDGHDPADTDVAADADVGPIDEEVEQ